jgi:hypothetical protein
MIGHRQDLFPKTKCSSGCSSFTLSMVLALKSTLTPQDGSSANKPMT